MKMSDKEKEIVLDTIQLKKITTDYNSKSKYVPAQSEPIYIDGAVEVGPCIVVGDGITSVEGLIVNGKAFQVSADVSEAITNSVQNVTSQSNFGYSVVTPQEDEVSGDLEDPEKLAKIGHSHTLSYDTLKKLGVRKIHSGTEEPTDDFGEVGDIYIKYQSSGE